MPCFGCALPHLRRLRFVLAEHDARGDERGGFVAASRGTNIVQLPGHRHIVHIAEDILQLFNWLTNGFTFACP